MATERIYFCTLYGRIATADAFFFFLATHKNKGNCREWSLRKLSFLLLLLLLLGCWTCNIDKAVNQKKEKKITKFTLICKAQSIFFYGGKSFIIIIFFLHFGHFSSQKPTLSTFVSRYHAAAATPKLEKRGKGTSFFAAYIYSRVTFFQTRRKRRRRKGNKITPEKKKRKKSPPLVSICQM